MTDTQYPITPPAELVDEWLYKPEFAQPGPAKLVTVTADKLKQICTAAAQWGADAELEACCEWLRQRQVTLEDHLAFKLYMARRPKPPSKVAQAEALIERHEDGWVPNPSDWHLIREALAEGRRALEQLPDD